MKRKRFCVVDSETGLLYWRDDLPAALDCARGLVEIEKTATVGKRCFEKILIARMCYAVNVEGELEDFQP